MNLRNLFRFRYYRKLVCSFILIGVLLVSMAVVCISILFSQMTVKRVGEMSVSNVRLAANSLDTLIENCENAAEVLMNEKYFYSVTSFTLDRQKEYYLMSSILKMKINYPSVRHMGVVNGKLDRYLGTRGVYFGCEEEIKEAMAAADGRQYTVFPRRVREYENTEESKKIPVLTFVYEPYNSRGSGTYIVIDLDLDPVKEALNSMGGGVWEQAALVSGDGKTILDPYAGAEYNSKELDALLDKIPEEGSGYFSGKIREGGSQALISFCRLSQVPWIIIGAQEKDRILSGFMDTQWLFMIGAVCVILVYVILSVFFSNYIYSPIKTIRDSLGPELDKSGNQDEMELIGNTFYSYRQREDCRRRDASPLRAVIRGVMGGAEAAEEDWRVEASPLMEALLAGAGYSVIVVSADLPSRQNDFYLDRQFYLYILMNMAGELLDEGGASSLGLSVTTSDETLFVLICKTDKPEIPAKTQMGLEEMQLGLHRDFGLSVSMGVSAVRTGTGSLRKGCQEAEEALKQRVLGGPMKLYFENDTPRFAPLKEYPAALDHRLQEQIAAADRAEVQKLTDEWFAQMKTALPEQASLYFHRLYASTLTKGISLLESAGVPLEKLETLWRAAYTPQDLAEMKQAYLLLCGELMDQMGKEVARSSTEQAVDEIKQYIEKNFSDPTISLTTLADRAGLSPSYLGQIFSKQIGITCADYLAQVRMEEAARKLLETNLTIQQISEQIGILNTSYFYTLFKKAYGMTPHRYRLKVK